MVDIKHVMHHFNFAHVVWTLFVFSECLMLWYLILHNRFTCCSLVFTSYLESSSQFWIVIDKTRNKKSTLTSLWVVAVGQSLEEQDQRTYWIRDFWRINRKHSYSTSNFFNFPIDGGIEPSNWLFWSKLKMRAWVLTDISDFSNSQCNQGLGHSVCVNSSKC